MARSTTQNAVEMKRNRTSRRVTIWSRLAVVCLAIGLWALSETTTSGAKKPPPQISSLYALAGDRAVRLIWNKATEPSVFGYHVYRKFLDDTAYTQVTESATPETTYVDQAVMNDTTYNYVITCVDTGFSEGPYSNQVAALPNRWILFVENWDIYRMDAIDADLDSLGDRKIQLTTDPAVDITPDLSPDGTKILFSSNRDDNFELYCLKSDGGELTRLTFNTYTDVSPSWSFDGKKLAYSSDQFNNYDIFIMNDDGGGITRMTDHSSYDGNPDWSPLSNLIAFDTNRDGGDYEVYLVDARQSPSPFNITNYPFEDGCPRWSSTGMTIVYSSRRQEAEWKRGPSPQERFNVCRTDTPWIHGVNFTAQSVYGESHNMYPNALPGQFDPADSTLIYFSSDLNGDAEIHLLKVLSTDPWHTEISFLTLDTLHNSPTGGVKAIQPEIIPPACPGDVSADTTPKGSVITLTWAPNVEDDFAFYCVYRDTVGDFITTPNRRLDTLTTITYRDTAVFPQVTYYYVVTAVDSVGSESGYTHQVSATVAVDEPQRFGILPSEFHLAQNCPNPFNPVTQIVYALPRRSRVRLTVHNLLGQKVATLVEEIQLAGSRTVQWDGRDDGGHEVASGIYFCRIHAGEFVRTRRMVLIR